MSNSWKIFFAGDIIIQKMPKKSLIFGELAKIVSEHDLISCNFETSIYAKSAKPIQKAFSPYEYMSENAAMCVKEAGFNVISLANNHMYDYGQEGLKTTLDAFSEQITVGIGLDFESAYELKMTDVKGTKIGFLSFGESEFGALTDSRLDRGGFAWVNHPSVNQRIVNAKKEVDVLIIQVHAGIERTDFPLPEWRQRYQEFIDLGADAVIGHHPHIPQGWEIYKEKPIFYSIGHFYFDLEKKHPLWDKAIGVSLSFNGPEFIGYQVIPIEKTEDGVNIYNDESFKSYLEYVCNILEPKIYYEYVDKQVAFLWENRYSYIYTQSIGIIPGIKQWSMLKKLLLKIDKKFGLSKYFIDNLALLHNIKIESHRWSTERALSNLSGNNSFKKSAPTSNYRDYNDTYKYQTKKS